MYDVNNGMEFYQSRTYTIQITEIDLQIKSKHIGKDKLSGAENIAENHRTQNIYYIESFFLPKKYCSSQKIF